MDRARSLWRDAGDRASTARVELFAKATLRSRVTRDLDGVSAKFDRVFESGLALRAFRAGQDSAGFAAATGLSTDVVRWAVDTACTYHAQASGSAPNPSDSIAVERWDLDSACSLPSEGDLSSGLMSRPHLEWIEAGTTIEVLIGAEGWLAARRRHRLWALHGGPGARLVAQRGFVGWEHLLEDQVECDFTGSQADQANPDTLVLTHEAASAVVAALVDAFHGTGAADWKASGDGWDVADEPVRPDGLAGGSFDDAGFPAMSQTLAANGFWVGKLEGPGTFWRMSFREPPRESASNLVMASVSEKSVPFRARVARRCRVLRPSAELWVMELDLVDPGGGGEMEHRWIRVEPQALLDACAARLGRSTVTSAGPIVPALRLDGLSLG